MKIPVLDGAQRAVDSINGFFEGFGNAVGFVKDLFTDPIGLLYKGFESFAKGFQVWGPDAMLLMLFILILLYFFGFEKSKKWIGIIFVIGMFLVSF